MAACRRLGLTRLILPQPIITRRSPAQRPREDGADGANGGRAARGWREALKVWWEGGEAGLDDDVREIFKGKENEKLVDGANDSTVAFFARFLKIFYGILEHFCEACCFSAMKWRLTTRPRRWWRWCGCG